MVLLLKKKYPWCFVYIKYKVVTEMIHYFVVFRGYAPSVAELMYLDNARKLSLHGVEMHPALV